MIIHLQFAFCVHIVIVKFIIFIFLKHQLVLLLFQVAIYIFLTVICIFRVQGISFIVLFRIQLLIDYSNSVGIQVILFS